MKRIVLFFCLLSAATSTILSQGKIHLKLTGPYLGQKAPGITPEQFAPGVVSTDDYIEMGCAWTPDGREFYFGRSETSDEWEAHGSLSHDGSYILFDRVESTFVSFREKDGTWSRGYNLGGKFHIPCVSPDGKYMFFESNGDIYWVDAKIIVRRTP